MVESLLTSAVGRSWKYFEKNREESSGHDFSRAESNRLDAALAAEGYTSGAEGPPVWRAVGMAEAMP